MKTLFALAAAFLLAACGTTSAVRIEAAAPDGVLFQVQDKRPQDERWSGVYDNLAGETAFFGDDNLSPPPLALLTMWLHKSLNAELMGKTVTLSRFTVTVFDPRATVDWERLDAAARAGPYGFIMADLIGMVTLAGKSIKNRKIVYVRVEGNVDDKKFSTIASETYRGRVTADNVKTTLTNALDQVVSIGGSW